ncbi:MAG: hypothetical protein V1735_02345 [Nanoarchaeota archaeon]
MGLHPAKRYKWSLFGMGMYFYFVRQRIWDLRDKSIDAVELHSKVEDLVRRLRAATEGMRSEAKPSPQVTLQPKETKAQKVPAKPESRHNDVESLSQTIATTVGHLAAIYLKEVKDSEHIDFAADRMFYLTKEGLKAGQQKTREAFERLATDAKKKVDGKYKGKKSKDAERLKQEEKRKITDAKDRAIEDVNKHWEKLRKALSQALRNLWNVSKAQYQSWTMLELKERLHSDSVEAILTRIKVKGRAVNIEAKQAKDLMHGIEHAKDFDELKREIFGLMRVIHEEIENALVFDENVKVLLFRIKNSLGELEQLERVNPKIKQRLEGVHRDIIRILDVIQAQKQMLFHEAEAA